MYMNIVVFGANGKIGSRVVEKLLSRGHHVTAFVHNNASDYVHDRLRYIEGDVYEKASVADALQGMDVVMSALGSWGTPKKDIVSTGIKHMVEELDGTSTRLISLTGAESRAEGDNLGLIHRIMHRIFSITAQKILIDGEAHIKTLEKSSLRWTVVRSPVMTETGSKKYKFTNRRSLPWETIHRDAVAQSMVDQVDDKTWLRKSPFIHRS